MLEEEYEEVEQRNGLAMQLTKVVAERLVTQNSSILTGWKSFFGGEKSLSNDTMESQIIPLIEEPLNLVLEASQSDLSAVLSNYPKKEALIKAITTEMQKRIDSSQAKNLVGKVQDAMKTMPLATVLSTYLEDNKKEHKNVGILNEPSQNPVIRKEAALPPIEEQSMISPTASVSRTPSPSSEGKSERDDASPEVPSMSFRSISPAGERESERDEIPPAKSPVNSRPASPVSEIASRREAKARLNKEWTQKVGKHPPESTSISSVKGTRHFHNRNDKDIKQERFVKSEELSSSEKKDQGRSL